MRRGFGEYVSDVDGKVYRVVVCSVVVLCGYDVCDVINGDVGKCE